MTRTAQWFSLRYLGKDGKIFAVTQVPEGKSCPSLQNEFGLFHRLCLPCCLADKAGLR